MIEAKFNRHFGHDADAYFVAPGRINLIGEHIDYCGGLVMPMAIDRSTRAAVRRNGESIVRVYTARFSEQQEIPLKGEDKYGDWRDFVVGLLALLPNHYDSPQGVDVYIEDDLDAGGLSSSASFSLLLGHILIWSSGQSLDWNSEEQLKLAKICQQVEHDYVGVLCGIMDQASIALGGIVMLDCASLSYDRLSGDFGDYSLVVMDTQSPRTLAGSKYNERVQEIAQIETSLRSQFEFSVLCDLPLEALQQATSLLESQTLKARLRHIVTEHERVQLAYKAIENNNMMVLGELINHSHQSLKEDYEVTGDALDTIVSISQGFEGSIGARMIGAGFGGCALALVKSEYIDAHNQWVIERYESSTGVRPRLFAVSVASAAGQVEP